MLQTLKACLANVFQCLGSLSSAVQTLSSCCFVFTSCGGVHSCKQTLPFYWSVRSLVVLATVVSHRMHVPRVLWRHCVYALSAVNAIFAVLSSIHSGDFTTLWTSNTTVIAQVTNGVNTNIAQCCEACFRASFSHICMTYCHMFHIFCYPLGTCLYIEQQLTNLQVLQVSLARKEVDQKKTRHLTIWL